MYRLQEVQKAKTDPYLMGEIYNHIFRNNRVKKWLTTRGFFNVEVRDELHSQLVVLFLRCFDLYKFNKISFEKFVWGKFRFCIINHFQSQKNKIINLDVDELSEITFHTGDIHDESDLKIDIEIIRRTLTGNTEKVFTAMSNGLTRKDMDGIGLDCRVWDNERIRIKSVMKRFDYIG